MSPRPDTLTAAPPDGMTFSNIEKNASGPLKARKPAKFLQLHLWEPGPDSLYGFTKPHFASESQGVELALGQTVVLWYFLFSK